MDPFKIKTKSGAINSYRVSDRYQHGLEWEESLIESASESPDEDIPEKNIFEKKRLWGLVFLVAFIFIMLVYQAVDFQIVKGEDFQVAAETNRVRKFPINSPRGVIFDRAGEQLVENIPSFQIVLTPADLLSREETEINSAIERISEWSGVAVEEIRAVAENSDRRSYEPKVVVDNLDRDKALIVESRRDEVVGFQVVANSRRQYKESSLAHVLGYTGSVNEAELEELKGSAAYFGLADIGKTGLEKIYDEELRGLPGNKQIEVDAAGREETQVAVKDPVPGKNLEISLDAGLQRQAAGNLSHIISSGGFSKGSFVALDPNNGEILALVSWPTFDNNVFAQGISVSDYQQLVSDPSQPLFNRAIGGTYASGSVLKPMVGLAALQEGIITERTTVNDIGYIEIENQYDPNIKYRFYGWNKNGLGPVNIYTAIALSSNPYFYQIGGGYQGFSGLGPELIGEYLKKFGFGSTLGIDLPGEANGFVPSREWKKETWDENWNLGDTYNLAIGQGYFLTTPLQMASATATIANGGKLYKPHLAKSWYEEGVAEKTSIEPEVINNQVGSSEYVNLIRRAMREAVINERGTARSLDGLPVAVAAKTGTAQFQGSTLEHSWFIAFAPYDNPTIALAVLVEEGGSGAEAAAIIARDTLNWYFGGRPESVPQ